MRGGQNALDLTGVRSGKLVAAYRLGRDRWRRALWRCFCDCGEFSSVIASQLAGGRIRSCGCERHSKRSADGRRFAT